MRGRSWRWGSTRIQALLTRPPVAFVREAVDEKSYRMRPVYATRTQTHFLGKEA